MNKIQALRKAQKLFGKNATVCDYGKESSPELRKTASTMLQELRKDCTTFELKKANGTALDRLRIAALHYRYTVGVIEMGMFNAIKACGDSWDGCFKAIAEQPNKGTAYEIAA